MFILWPEPRRVTWIHSNDPRAGKAAHVLKSQGFLHLYKSGQLLWASVSSFFRVAWGRVEIQLQFFCPLSPISAKAECFNSVILSKNVKFKYSKWAPQIRVLKYAVNDRSFKHKELKDFFLIDLYWSIIASQYCVSFCCTTKWISHMHTYIPISPPSWASLPSSLSHPSRSSQSTELISRCYEAASH